jgi:hypothetical protein
MDVTRHVLRILESEPPLARPRCGSYRDGAGCSSAEGELAAERSSTFP